MRDDAERYYAGRGGIATLVLGVLLPPLAWILHLSVGFTVATASCGSDIQWLLHLLTAGALGVSIGGGLLAGRNWRATGEDTNPDEAGTLGRSRFLAIAGLASCAFFTFAILAAAVANVLVGSCTH